MAFFAYF